MPELIIASSSRYRHQRLREAGLRFSYASPDIDETPLPNETAEALSVRLARIKCEKIANRYQKGLVVGCDQVAAVLINDREEVLHKPYTVENAKAQLSLCSGQLVTFYTALHLIDIAHKRAITKLEPVQVKFRQLSDAKIEDYLRIDQPLDCAGSFKMEKAGILLFESISSTDPNALIGIPMIALANSLEELGYEVFDFVNLPSG